MFDSFTRSLPPLFGPSAILSHHALPPAALLSSFADSQADFCFCAAPHKDAVKKAVAWANPGVGCCSLLPINNNNNNDDKDDDVTAQWQ